MRRLRSWLAPLVVLSGLCVPDGAQARGVEERLASIEAEIAEVSGRADELSRQVAPGRGFITQSQAIQRYQDCVYLHMIGEYEPAAEGFFALVTTAALSDADLHLDAEWYLAESLYQMGNIVTAEARFQVIAEDASHPFRDEAVRRLLELYATTDQTEAFYAYYDQEIVRGRVRPSALITYSVARSFYHQGDLVQAKSHLQDIDAESPYYRKALYYLGAIMVIEGSYDQAVDYFRQVLELSVDTYEDRQVQDLSLLALGRLHLEQGDFEEAADYYSRIGGDSEYLADKLYELVWTFIKQRQRLVAEIEANRDTLASDERVRWEDRAAELITEALRGVEIFLLAYPEHQYTAQLKLLEGHLQMQAVEYDAALTAYEKVIDDYTPIHLRFADLADSDVEPEEYFQRIRSLEQGAVAGADGLPAYALAMMMADDDLSRSLSIYRALEHQTDNIETSEALIGELEAVLQASVGIGGFEQIRYDVILNQNMALQHAVDLLEVEETWLVTNGNGAVRREVEGLRAQRLRIGEDAEVAMTITESVQEEIRAYQDEVRQVQRVRDQLAESIKSLEQEADELRRTLVVEGEALDPETRTSAQDRLVEVEAELEEARLRLPGVEIELSELLAHPVSSSEAGALNQVLSDIQVLHLDLQSRYPGDAEAREMKERLARDQGELAEAQASLGDAVDRLGRMEGSELDRIRARFQHEVREVASQRVELERTLKEAEEVSVGLTRAGFGRLEDFFAESVLKADMGIVDVYWAQKLDVADQRKRMQEEKNLLLADLERRFEFIRAKMKQ